MKEGKYIRVDCDNGELTNASEIAYYKATQREEIITNIMLGDYNQNGEYIIDENIVLELVSMPKQIINSFSNMIFCQSLVVTEFIQQEKFVVKIKQDDNNPEIKISVLEIMETVKKADGLIINTVSTPIAKYVDVNSDEYNNKMFNAFNIIDATEFSVQQAEQFNRGFVSLRRKYISALSQLCSNQLIEAGKDAYNKKLEILKSSGEVGQSTLKLFEERLNKNPLIASQNDFKALNELLDSAIEVNKANLQPVMNEVQEVGVNYADKIQNIENLANLNLKTLQKSYSASATITTQQAVIEKNIKITEKTIKSIVTEAAIKNNYALSNNSTEIQPDIKQEQKNKNNILKNIFGAFSTKENKKEPVKEKTSKQKEPVKEKAKEGSNKPAFVKVEKAADNKPNTKEQPNKKSNVIIAKHNVKSIKESEQIKINKQKKSQENLTQTKLKETESEYSEEIIVGKRFIQSVTDSRDARSYIENETTNQKRNKEHVKNFIEDSSSPAKRVNNIVNKENLTKSKVFDETIIVPSTNKITIDLGEDLEKDY